MKTKAMVLSAFTLSLFAISSLASSAAFAAEPSGPAAPDPDVVAKRGPSIGYQVEGAVASTHVLRGVPKYATKTTPATEDLAYLKVKDLGPGTVTAGVAYAMAISGSSGLSPFSTEISPSAIYGVKVGKLETQAGGRMWIYPRNTPSDFSYEGVLRGAYRSSIVTPVLELYPEFVQRRGIYAVAGVERVFQVAPWLAVRPRISTSAQGYEAKSERPHSQDVTACVFAKVPLPSGFYVGAKTAYAVVTAPDHYLKNPDFGGRSIFYGGLAFGAER